MRSDPPCAQDAHAEAQLRSLEVEDLNARIVRRLAVRNPFYLSSSRRWPDGVFGRQSVDPDAPTIATGP